MLSKRKRVLPLLLILLCAAAFSAPLTNKLTVSASKIIFNTAVNLSARQDTLIDFCYESIEKASDDFYKDYLKTSPTVAKDDIAVLDIEPVEQGCKVVFQTRPFIGSHLYIATDEIAFLIFNDGVIQLETFSHIESADFPADMQDLLIKPLPSGNDA